MKRLDRAPTHLSLGWADQETAATQQQPILSFPWVQKTIPAIVARVKGGQVFTPKEIPLILIGGQALTSPLEGLIIDTSMAM